MNTNLKGYRVMAGYTQEDIANELNISRISYIHRENGKSRFTENEEKQIFKILNKKLPSLKREDVFPIE